MQAAELTAESIHHEQTYSRSQKAIGGTTQVIALQPLALQVCRRNNDDGTVRDQGAIGKSDFESNDDLKSK